MQMAKMKATSIDRASHIFIDDFSGGLTRNDIDLPLIFHPARTRVSAFVIRDRKLDRRTMEFSGF